MSQRRQSSSSPWKRLQRRLRSGLRPIQGPEGCISSAQYIRQNPTSVVVGPNAPVHVQRTPPPPPGRALQWRFDAWLDEVVPPTWVLEIRGGRAAGEGVVLTPENQILLDVSVDFRAPSGEHRLQQRSTMPRPTPIDGRLAVLASAEGNTYYHWLFDIVPRLQLLGDTPFDHLLVQCGHRFQRDWLTMLDVPLDQVIPATKHGHQRPDVLLVPSLPSPNLHVTPTSCSYLRDIAERAGCLAPAPTGRRVYVCREDASRRRLQDEGRIWMALRSHGFERVNPGGLSAAEQIRLFSEADVVAGPHGAGFSNIVFCAPGTRVLEFFSPAYLNPCFWAVAEAVGLRYDFLLGRGALPNEGTEPRSIGDDITLDVTQLHEALHALLGSS